MLHIFCDSLAFTCKNTDKEKLKGVFYRECVKNKYYNKPAHLRQRTQLPYPAQLLQQDGNR